MNPSTVRRIVKKFHNTGDVQREHSTRSNPIKLTTVIQMFVLDLVFKTPGIYLDEIQRKVCEKFCVHIDISNICRFLKKSGLSHQKCKLKLSYATR